jgi:hypothetical protein
MDLGLKGRRALVTGASKGIGLAVAKALAAEGCDIDIVARDEAGLSKAAAGLDRSGVTVRAHKADLSQHSEQQRIAEICAPADILVNNAGSNAAGSLDDTDDHLWRSSWDLKVFGYVNLSNLFYRAMKVRGQGVILNIIGYAGERLNARYIIGSTGNAALMAFTRSVGSQSPDFGVRILGLNPGFTATDRAEGQLRTFSQETYGTPDRWKDVERDLKLPFGRMARTDEIAEVAAFLVSARASYMSGTVVSVEGGATHRNF